MVTCISLGFLLLFLHSVLCLESNLKPCDPYDKSDWIPCRNGGACLTAAIKPEKRSPFCLCSAPYYGFHCQNEDFSAAQRNRFRNREKREAVWVNFLNATVDITPCTGTALTCSNGGRCFKISLGQLSGLICVCPSGFGGVSCETRGKIVGAINLDNSPRSVVTWQHKVYISLSFDPRILVFDKTSVLNQTNATELMDLPVPSQQNYGLAVDTSNGTLYVASYYTGHVYKVDQEQDGRTCFSMLKPNITYPTAIALDGKGHLFVWSQRCCGYLSRYDTTDGSHNKTYKQQIGMAYGYGMVIKGDKLYVTDSYRNQVLVFQLLANEEISLMRTIRTDNEPRGLAVDNKGNIIVASCYYDDISIYDPNGNKLAQLLKGQLDCPWGLWFDESSGYIFVADSGNKAVKVVDYSVL